MTDQPMTDKEFNELRERIGCARNNQRILAENKQFYMDQLAITMAELRHDICVCIGTVDSNMRALECIK